MQTLDVVSVNIWQILISLVNLLLMFLIIKHFFYKKVKLMLDTRKREVDEQYEQADQAKAQALADKQRYEEKLSEAKKEAEGIIQSAVTTAKRREKEILDDAKNEAQGIVRQAEENAALEMKKAEGAIKREIVDVSAKLTEKVLGRAIASEDHEQLIDSFINNLGDQDGTNQ